VELSRWSPFTPPQWKTFTPPLTAELKRSFLFENMVLGDTGTPPIAAAMQLPIVNLRCATSNIYENTPHLYSKPMVGRSKEEVHAVVTRYEELAINYVSLVQIDMIRLLVRRLGRPLSHKV
jgi:hypothetical protein